MRCNSPVHPGAGFTLAEVVFSVTIIAVAVLAAVAAITSGLKGQSQNRYQAAAAVIGPYLLDRAAGHKDVSAQASTAAASALATSTYKVYGNLVSQSLITAYPDPVGSATGAVGLLEFYAHTAPNAKIVLDTPNGITTAATSATKCLLGGSLTGNSIVLGSLILGFHRTGRQPYSGASLAGTRTWELLVWSCDFDQIPDIAGVKARARYITTFLFVDPE